MTLPDPQGINGARIATSFEADTIRPMKRPAEKEDVCEVIGNDRKFREEAPMTGTFRTFIGQSEYAYACVAPEEHSKCRMRRENRLINV